MPETQHQRCRGLPFVVAVSVASAFVLAAPFIGEIRRAILTRFPGQFVRIIGGLIAVALAAAVLMVIGRIRDRRGWRYAAIVTALAIGVGYGYFSRTGNPQVDAVERFHFVQYGLITLLFYRAWRPAGDPSALVLPALAGLLVGTIEEWLQWFIPVRVGEVRDVFLNGVAIACGLIFSTAVYPPVNCSPGLTSASRRRIGVFAAGVLLVFAAFFQSVHLGTAIAGQGWTFRSCYTAARLDALASDRTERWRDGFVDRPKRLAVEDQYMTEGHWHVAQRNAAWAAGDFKAAWSENLILERYFAPVLDTPSYVSRAGHRWSPEHRIDAERRYGALPAPGLYASDAHPSAIYLWPKMFYWMAVLLVATALAAPWVRRRLRGDRAPGWSRASVGR